MGGVDFSASYGRFFGFFCRKLPTSPRNIVRTSLQIHLVSPSFYLHFFLPFVGNNTQKQRQKLT